MMLLAGGSGRAQDRERGVCLVDLHLLEEYLSSGHLSTNTREAYHRDLSRLAAFLTSTRYIQRWGDTTGADLLAWLEKLVDEGKSEASLARAMSSVRAFFRFLDRGRHIAKDPTVGLSLEPDKKDALLPRSTRAYRISLSVEEVERLLAGPAGDTGIAVRDRALLELLYGSGLSVSEVIELRVADVDLRLECVRTKHRGKKSRVVPLSRTAVAAIRSYMEKTRPLLAKAEVNVLFLNRRGKPLTRQGVWKIIKGYGDRVGIQGLNPNALRSSFAAHLLANGANLAAVQEMMGHRAAATTQSYFVREPEVRLRDEYERAHPRAAKNKPPKDGDDEH